MISGQELLGISTFLALFGRFLAQFGLQNWLINNRESTKRKNNNSKPIFYPYLDTYVVHIYENVVAGCLFKKNFFPGLFRDNSETAEVRRKSERPICSPINALQKRSFKSFSIQQGSRVTVTFMRNFGKAQNFKLKSPRFPVE